MNEEDIFDLSGRKTLITGGAGNIGAATARAMSRRGASVALADLNLEGAEKVAETIRATGGDAKAIAMDVTEPDGVEKGVKTVLEHWGHIDVLFNNVGINHRHPAEELSIDVWERVLRVNLTGEFIVAQTVARESMIPRSSGSIINMASVSGRLGHPGQIAYAAAKHGVIGMTKVFAIEWAKHNIRVNAVGPGVLETPMAIGTTYRKGPEREKLAEKVPLGRLATPEDVAATVVFLATSAASYITGQTFFVEGGRMID